MFWYTHIIVRVHFRYRNIMLKKLVLASALVVANCKPVSTASIPDAMLKDFYRLWAKHYEAQIQLMATDNELSAVINKIKSYCTVVGLTFDDTHMECNGKSTK